MVLSLGAFANRLEIKPLKDQLPIKKSEFTQFEKYITKDGDIKTFPYMKKPGGMDGFFISRLYKEY